jgi:hypothetical protein
MGLEEKLQKIADKKGAIAAWDSMSMGGGRELEPYGKCAKSPDGKHHYRAASNVQSVERFVCGYCEDWYYD